jgi:hypothetical protein
MTVSMKLLGVKVGLVFISYISDRDRSLGMQRIITDMRLKRSSDKGIPAGKMPMKKGRFLQTSSIRSKQGKP